MSNDIKEKEVLSTIWYVWAEYEGINMYAGYFLSEESCQKSIDENPQWRDYGDCSPARLFGKSFKGYDQYMKYDRNYDKVELENDN